MASIVAVNTTWNTTAGNKGTSPVPNVGELIVAIAAASGMASGITVSDGQPGGTYTQIGTFALGNTSADALAVFVRNALIASSVSHAITAAEGTSTGGGICTIRVAGMRKTGSAAVRSVSAVAQFVKAQNQAAGTPSLTLPAAPLPSNPIIGAILTASNSTANSAPPTNFTEQADVGYTTPTTGLEVVTRDSGHASATVAWTAATPSIFAALAIELDSSFPSLINQRSAQRMYAHLAQ
jgi:hypothetical protein